MKTSVWAIIRDPRGQYLLLKRDKRINNGGQWNFPGGSVERDESPLDAVTRECKEEIGLKVLKPRLVNETTTPSKIKECKYFTCTIPKSGVIKLNGENSSYSWFTRDEALGLNLHEPTLLYLKNKPKFRSKLVRSDLFKEIVGEVDGIPVASAFICVATGLLHDVRVDDGHRGMGYAHDLMNHVMASEPSPIKLTARPSNGSPIDVSSLVRFYEGYGFKATSSSPVAVRMTRPTRRHV